MTKTDEELVAESKTDEYHRVHQFSEDLDKAITELEQKYSVSFKKNKFQLTDVYGDKWEVQLRKFVTSSYSVMEIEKIKDKHREIVKK